MKRKDYFVSTCKWYWIIEIFSPIYCLSLLAYAILLLNVNITDGYCAVYPCGTYFSLRYTSLQWISLAFTSMRFVMFIFFCGAVIYRRDFGCSVFWFILLLALVIMDVFSFISLTKFYVSCHDGPYNICNDINYCCASEVYSVASNHCKNTGPCPVGFPTSIAQLRPNETFKWIYFTSLFYVLFEVLTIVFLASVNFSLNISVRLPTTTASQGETKMTKGE